MLNNVYLTTPYSISPQQTILPHRHTQPKSNQTQKLTQSDNKTFDYVLIFPRPKVKRNYMKRKHPASRRLITMQR